MTVGLEIKVAGRWHAVELEDGKVTVDGQAFPVRVRNEAGQALASAGDQVHVIALADARTALVDGQRVPFTLRSLRGVAGAPTEKGAGHGPVRPPMSGRIEALTVQAGQEVAAGDVLFVLEAMKMRNEVKAPVAGRVANLRVQAGAAVDAGMAVLDLEPLDA